MKFSRYYVEEDKLAEEYFDWKTVDVKISSFEDDSTVFEQTGVEFPSGWSQQACTVVTQKYFYGQLGSPARERSLKGLVNRVVDTLVAEGDSQGYFDTDEDREIFREELKYIIYSQQAAFNSPVWFNVGAVGHDDARHACWLLDVEDNLPSILGRVGLEGIIFAAGAGTGANASKLRSSFESLSSGGTASGPVSFMKGYSSMAGVIKSGGRTRRSAKMEILNVDHPDVYHGKIDPANPDFIRCKAFEEEKARKLAAAGFNTGMDGEIYGSLSFQNANNSVRVTDEFMRAVEANELWELKSVTTGEVVAKYPAADIMRAMAEAAWSCGCPGIQFNDAINDWHTCPNSGPIQTSNPCSEYHFVPFTACNLASMRLTKFFRWGACDKSDAGRWHFAQEDFLATTRIMTVALDMLQDNAWYPTDKFKSESLKYRTIGLGLCDVGAQIFRMGFSYASEAGRCVAATTTALMTACAYDTSSKLAKGLGSFPELSPKNMQAIIDKHIVASHDLIAANSLSGMDFIFAEAQEAISSLLVDASVCAGNSYMRNAQVTLFAPTGTIGFMMDCTTTGIEPIVAHRVYKNLAGGGDMVMENGLRHDCLRSLGYSENVDIEQLLKDKKAVEEDDDLREVFRTALYDNRLGLDAIHWSDHLNMMAAVQPFLSGAISKTVNLPSSTTVEEIQQVYTMAWTLSLKAVAIYRDGSKGGQPLTTDKNEKSDCRCDKPKSPKRYKLPKDIAATRHKFSIGGVECYMHQAEYPKGVEKPEWHEGPAEIFLRASTLGNTVNGLAECLAATISVAVQYGVPWKSLIDKYKNMEFKPSGFTSCPEVPSAKSIPDFIARWVEQHYGLTTEFDIEIERMAAEAADGLGISIDNKLGYYSIMTCPGCKTPMRMISATCHQCPNCYFSDGTCAG